MSLTDCRGKLWALREIAKKVLRDRQDEAQTRKRTWCTGRWCRRFRKKRGMSG